MGGTQSTPAGGGLAVASKQGEAEPTGGYRIAGAKEATKTPLKFASIEEAYQKGKEEGLETVNTSLSVVAAQVYENVNNQLLDLQEKHIALSKQLASEVGAKLAPITYESKSCLNEKEELASCLKQNKGDAIACNKLADLFSRCAYESVADKNSSRS